jgi:peptidoglycan/xylan/chitin deacetylase (PgdA/CDA1 family)
MRSWRSLVVAMLACLTGLGACSSSGNTPKQDAGSGPSPSGLPVPPGGGQPMPSGAPGGLTVLDWAGFKSAVSWTFDDSQPSQIAHYAELAAVGLPMTFYISTGLATEANYDATWSQAVADGSEIGNHTVHHCQANLTGCSFGTALATVEDELDQASAYIAQHYPAQGGCWTAASPFGDTGYDSAASSRFLVNRGVPGGTIAAKDSTDPFNLPIYLAQMNDTATVFNAKIDAAHSAGRWLVVLIHTINPTSDTWYNPVDVGEITSSMGYGKSLGDVWTDSVVHVAAYWIGQKLLSAATPVASGDAQTWTWTLPAHFPPGRYLRVTVTGGTLTQNGAPLAWDDHGYYEVALDAGSLTLSP